MKPKSFLFLLLAFLVTDSSAYGSWYHFDIHDIGLEALLSKSFEGVKTHLLIRDCAKITVQNVETSGISELIRGASYKNNVTYRSTCPKKFPFAPAKLQTCVVTVVPTQVFDGFDIYEMNVNKCERPQFEGLPSFNGPNRGRNGEGLDAIVGVIKRMGLSSSYLRNLSDFALRQLETRARKPMELKFIDVIDATLQIQGGYLERFLVLFAINFKDEAEKSIREERAICYFQVLNQFVNLQLQDHDCDKNFL